MNKQVDEALSWVAEDIRRAAEQGPQAVAGTICFETPGGMLIHAMLWDGRPGSATAIDQDMTDGVQRATQDATWPEE